MSYCENCAIEFDDKKKFCKFCGSRLKRDTDGLPNQDDVLDPLKTEAGDGDSLPPGRGNPPAVNPPVQSGLTAGPAPSDRLPPSTPSSVLSSTGNPDADSEAALPSAEGQPSKGEEPKPDAEAQPSKGEEPKPDAEASTGEREGDLQPSAVSPPSPGAGIPDPAPTESRRDLQEPATVPRGKIILLILAVAVFLVTAGGYWGYVSLTEKSGGTLEAGKISGRATGEGQQREERITKAAPSPQEEFAQVIATLKQANLTKNIDLFLSCYSPEFKSLKEKKSATLASWEQYDYRTLDYTLRDQRLSDSGASAVVEWSMNAYSRRTGESLSTKMAFRVVMRKENNLFKIVALEKIP